MFKLSNMFGGFGGKNNKNNENNQNNQYPPDAPRMRPQTPGSSAKHSPSRDADYRPSNTSIMNMSNPFEKAAGAGGKGRGGDLSPRSAQKPDLSDQQPTENLLDRSVKITFPKKGEGSVISEAVLREKLGRFGDLVNVSKCILIGDNDKPVLLSDVHSALVRHVTISISHSLRYSSSNTYALLSPSSTLSTVCWVRVLPIGWYRGPQAVYVRSAGSTFRLQQCATIYRY